MESNISSPGKKKKQQRRHKKPVTQGGNQAAHASPARAPETGEVDDPQQEIAPEVESDPRDGSMPGLTPAEVTAAMHDHDDASTSTASVRGSASASPYPKTPIDDAPSPPASPQPPAMKGRPSPSRPAATSPPARAKVAVAKTPKRTAPTTSAATTESVGSASPKIERAAESRSSNADVADSAPTSSPQSVSPSDESPSSPPPKPLGSPSHHLLHADAPEFKPSPESLARARVLTEQARVAHEHDDAGIAHDSSASPGLRLRDLTGGSALSPLAKPSASKGTNSTPAKTSPPRSPEKPIYLPRRILCENGTVVHSLAPYYPGQLPRNRIDPRADRWTLLFVLYWCTIGFPMFLLRINLLLPSLAALFFLPRWIASRLMPLVARWVYGVRVTTVGRSQSSPSSAILSNAVSFLDPFALLVSDDYNHPSGRGPWAWVLGRTWGTTRGGVAKGRARPNAPIVFYLADNLRTFNHILPLHDVSIQPAVVRVENHWPLSLSRATSTRTDLAAVVSAALDIVTLLSLPSVTVTTSLLQAQKSKTDENAALFFSRMANLVQHAAVVPAVG